MRHPFISFSTKERAAGCDDFPLRLEPSVHGQAAHRKGTGCRFPQAWRLWRERYHHCIRGLVSRDGQRDGFVAEHPIAALTKALERPGMALRLE